MPEEYYQSAHTGLQIDNAVNRIVNGELDKLAASATNAAEAAKSALSGIEEAIDNIPAGSTPIVNNLTTGGASAALSAEMGKILGRRPNPNHVINWNFMDPVNQLGQTEYTQSGYTIDRWKSSGVHLNLLLADDGITITNKSSTSAHFLRHYFETSNCFTGRQMTFGVLFSDGTLKTKTEVITRPESGTRYNCLISMDESEVYCAVAVNSSGTTSVAIRVGIGKSLSIAALKLEYGPVQTLAHQDSDGTWVLNDFWDKAAALADCQRYMLVVGYSAAAGFLTQARTYLKLMIPTPVPMRINPTVTEYNITGVRTTVGSNITPEITAVTVDNATSNGVMITAKTETFNVDPYVNNTPIGVYIQKLVFDAT